VAFQKDHPQRQGVGPETFPSLSVAADVAANSRIWNGIHFRFAGEAALITGRRVGRDVIRTLELEPAG